MRIIVIREKFQQFGRRKGCFPRGARTNTLKMRGRNLFFTGLVVALLGLVLILFRTSLADGGVVIAAGILFVVAGDRKSVV